MNKIILITIIAMLSSIAQAASSYSYKCITDTKKEIRLDYSYSYNYTLEKLTIDGKDYRQGTSLSVTRGDGIQLTVNSFKDGANLFLRLMGPNGSNYQLGSNGVRTMTCVDVRAIESSNGGI